MILKLLKQLFDRPIILKPTLRGSKCWQLIRPYLMKKTNKIYLLDSEYKLINKKILRDYLIKNSLSETKYKKNINDCDDYAIHLYSLIRKKYPGICFGFAMNENHAFNIFIDENKKVWVVEPQEDWIFEPMKDKTYKYKLEMVLI